MISKLPVLILISSIVLFNGMPMANTLNDSVNLSITEDVTPDEVSELIIIRVYESNTLNNKSEIQVIKGESIESISLDVTRDSNRESINKEIYSVLKKYIDSGFEIVSSTTTSAGEAAVVSLTTYIMQK